MRRLILLAAVGLVMGGCTRQPPPEDPNEAAAEDDALNQLQENAQALQGAGVILNDPHLGQLPTGEAANVQ